MDMQFDYADKDLYKIAHAIYSYLTTSCIIMCYGNWLYNKTFIHITGVVIIRHQKVGYITRPLFISQGW